MFRPMISATSLAVTLTLSLNAQVPIPGASPGFPDASTRVPSRIDPVVRIGAFLQERSGTPETATTLPIAGAQQPTPASFLTIPNPIDATRSFTVDPRLPGEYGVRNNFNPLENYSIRLQPWDGFTIQNNMNPMESYAVSPQPWGGFNVQNRMNPTETYTVPSHRFDNFGMRTFQTPDRFQPWSHSDPFSRGAFPEPASFQPGGSGFQNNFGVPNPPASSLHLFPVQSVPSGSQSPFKLP